MNADADPRPNQEQAIDALCALGESVQAPCSSVFIVRCNGYENRTIFSAWMSRVNAEQEAARLNTASRATQEDEHHVVVEEVALHDAN